MDMLEKNNMNRAEAFQSWCDLRDMLFSLVCNTMCRKWNPVVYKRRSVAVLNLSQF